MLVVKKLNNIEKNIKKIINDFEYVKRKNLFNLFNDNNDLLLDTLKKIINDYKKYKVNELVNNINLRLKGEYKEPEEPKNKRIFQNPYNIKRFKNETFKDYQNRYHWYYYQNKTKLKKQPFTNL